IRQGREGLPGCRIALFPDARATVCAGPERTHGSTPMHARIVLPLLILLALLLYAIARATTGADGTATAGDAAATASGATVWLVRHAEAGSGPDPALTPAGVARADAWYATLGSPALRRAYATD